MPALAFPPDVLAQIERDRFLHPCPQVQRRTEHLRFAAHGLPRADLLRLTSLSRATVKCRLDADRDGVLDAVCRWGDRGQSVRLAPHTLPWRSTSAATRRPPSPMRPTPSSA